MEIHIDMKGAHRAAESNNTLFVMFARAPTIPQHGLVFDFTYSVVHARLIHLDPITCRVYNILPTVSKATHT
jgi:hypothetical protein